MKVDMHWSLSTPGAQAIFQLPSTIELYELEDIEKAIAIQIRVVRRNLEQQATQKGHIPVNSPFGPEDDVHPGFCECQRCAPSATDGGYERG